MAVRFPGGVLVRAVLALMAAVGLVAMHQFAAAAHAGPQAAVTVAAHGAAQNGGAHHDGAQHGMAPHGDHDCDGAAPSAAATIDCHSMDHACAAVLSGSWTIPAAGKGLIGVLPASTTVPALLSRMGGGADPPDLNVLSVSRT